MRINDFFLTRHRLNMEVSQELQHHWFVINEAFHLRVNHLFFVQKHIIDVFQINYLLKVQF